MLTGRYQFRPQASQLVVWVEDHSGEKGYFWREATVNDLSALEPAVADGWRFINERDGILGIDGKRHRPL